MRTLYKVLLGLTSVLVVLFLALAFTVTYYIDPNHYKDDIKHYVAESTGRELQILGDIRWKLFPTLGFKLPPIRLEDTEPFNQKTLASVKSAEISIKLLPLLQKELVFDTLALSGFEINVVKNQDNELNIDSIFKQHPKDKAQKSGTDSTSLGLPTSADKPSQLSLVIKSINIETGTLNWLDETNQQQFTIKDISFQGRQLSTKSAFPISMGFSLASEKPALKGNFSLSSQVLIQSGAIELQDLRTNIQLSGDTLFLGNHKLKLHTEQARLVTGATPSLQLEDFSLTYNELSISGYLKTAHSGEETQLLGRLDIPTFNLRTLLSDISPSLTQDLPSQAYNKVGLSVNLDGNFQQLALSKLSATLDNSLLTGQILLGFPPIPRFDFVLTLNEIDLDTYLPKSKANHQPSAQAPSEKVSKEVTPNEGAASRSWLNSLDMNGKLNIQRIKVKNAVAGRVQAVFRARNGQYRLGPMSAYLYDGEYRGTLNANLSNNPVSWEMEHRLEHINLQDLLTSLQLSDRLSGTASFYSKLYGHGLEHPALLPTLSGNAALTLSDGTIHGIDLAYQWAAARQLLGKGRNSMTNEGKTDIANLSATWQVEEGIAHSSDLQLYNNSIYATGNGLIDLPSNTLSYTLLASEVQRTRNSNGEMHYDAGTPQLPIQLDGPINEPQVSLDAKAIKQMVIEKASDRLIDRVLGGDEDKSSPEKEAVKQIFKGLFGN